MPFSKQKQIRCLADTDCQGTVQVEHITYALRVGKRAINVPNIEVWVCSRCGSRFFPAESSRQIEAYKRYPGNLNVHVKPELHAQLARQAKEHQRSLEQEVSYLLERGLRQALHNPTK